MSNKCARCGKCHDNDKPFKEEEAIDSAAQEMARRIDNEIIADMVAQAALKKRKVADGYLKGKDETK